MLTDLREIGIEPGDVVMVHAGVRSVGPIVGGVNSLVGALLGAVGPEGTLVAYVDWECGFEEPIDPTIADDIPAFDRRIAKAARAYGILPESLRTWPGAIRSENPDAGVAAVGPRAAWLCADHALSYGYGEESPYAKLVAIGATVLVIGAPLDTMTLLHHAEHVARLDAKRVKRYRRKVFLDERPAWVDVEEFDTSDPIVAGMPDDHFAQIAAVAIESGQSRRGAVGSASAHAFDAGVLHRIGVRWLEEWKPAVAGPGVNLLA